MRSPLSNAWVRKGPWAPVCAAVLIVCTAHAARAGIVEVAPCPIDANCAAVEIGTPDSPVVVGEPAAIRLVFQQGDSDEAAGGIDQIAALNLSISIPGLGLADCSAPGANGLNPSFSVPSGPLGSYRVVVQNLTCAGRSSCLCPTGTNQLDTFINLLVVGNRAAAGVLPLPNGTLLGISLRARPGVPLALPLHVFSAVDDPSEVNLPPTAARLSIGDSLAVDRTVDDVGDTLNVRITDGVLNLINPTPTPIATATATASAPPTATASATEAAASPTAEVTVTPTLPLPVCIGDCNGSGEVTINELIAGVAIALGSQPLSTCPAFDCQGNGQVGVSCLVAAVNTALQGSCGGS